MKVYLYDTVSGVFIGEHVCQKSPLEKDVFLKPVNCTEKVPPAVDAEHVPVFKNGSWVTEINTNKLRKFLTPMGLVRANTPPENATAIVNEAETETDASMFKLSAPGLFGLPTATVNSTKRAARDLKRSRKAKLDAFRAIRNEKLSEVDVLVNDIVLGETPYTAEQVKAYRKALKDATDAFKDFETNTARANALDALDVAAYPWPKVGQ